MGIDRLQNVAARESVLPSDLNPAQFLAKADQHPTMPAYRSDTSYLESCDREC